MAQYRRPQGQPTTTDPQTAPWRGVNAIKGNRCLYGAAGYQRRIRNPKQVITTDRDDCSWFNGNSCVIANGDIASYEDFIA